jgi:hypothetical protein
MRGKNPRPLWLIPVGHNRIFHKRPGPFDEDLPESAFDHESHKIRIKQKAHPARLLGPSAAVSD